MLAIPYFLIAAGFCLCSCNLHVYMPHVHFALLFTCSPLNRFHLQLFLSRTRLTHSRTHIHIYVAVYMCVCLCARVNAFPLLPQLLVSAQQWRSRAPRSVDLSQLYPYGYETYNSNAFNALLLLSRRMQTLHLHNSFVSHFALATYCIRRYSAAILFLTCVDFSYCLIVLLRSLHLFTFALRVCWRVRVSL